MNRKPYFLACIAGVAIAAAALFEPAQSSGQADSDGISMAAMIEELTAQQAAIVTNQSKIDEKLGVIAEDLRLARIYVGRGGGKATAP